MKLPELKIASILCIFILIACNDVNDDLSNNIFRKFSPATREYKDELATRLKTNPESLHYTFNKFVENNGNEYLDIQIKGENFKATGLVLVMNWHKLERIKATKGKGYSGAELKGLKLNIEENSSGANLVYKDLEKIVD